MRGQMPLSLGAAFLLGTIGVVAKHSAVGHFEQRAEPQHSESRANFPRANQGRIPSSPASR